MMQAYTILRDVVLKVGELRCSFEWMIEEATTVCTKWGIQTNFSKIVEKEKEHRSILSRFWPNFITHIYRDFSIDEPFLTGSIYSNTTYNIFQVG